MASAFSSVGSGSASAVGVRAGRGIGSAAGSSAAAAIATSIAQSVGGAVGQSGVDAAGVPAYVAAGAATAQAVSSLLWGAPGASQGIGAVAGVGATVWESRATEVDTAIAVHGLTLIATGVATSDVSSQSATYASSGVATDTVILLEKRRSVGSAAGVSDVSFRTELAETPESSGAATDSLAASIRSIENSIGEATDDIEVVQRRYAVAASAGACAASAQAIGGTNGVGAAIGAASAVAVGLGASTAAAEVSAIATVAGIGQAVFDTTATAAGMALASAASRGRQVETLVSSADAEDAMQFAPPTVYPVFWSNTIAGAGATWEGLPFNSMVEADGKVYAAGAGGLYRLDNLGDDDGVDVEADIEWDLVEGFRTDYKQRSRSLYINAIADGPFTVTVSNKQGQFSTPTHLPGSTKTVNHRAPIGRGLCALVTRIGVRHSEYFSVADIALNTGDTTRRI